MMKKDENGYGGPLVYESVAASKLHEEDVTIYEDDEERDEGIARGTPGRIAEGDESCH
jgi:hypothetical protein